MVVVVKVGGGGRRGGGRGGTELDDGMGFSGGELPRVTQQVLQRQAQEAGVSVGDEALFDLELDLAPGLRLLQLGGDVARQGTQVDGPAAHLRARHPREVQEVVYEEGHAPAGGAYAPHVAAALSVELDRKSTRLNSSHANISYAVFCLKKKKTVTARRPPRL